MSEPGIARLAKGAADDLKKPATTTASMVKQAVEKSARRSKEALRKLVGRTFGKDAATVAGTAAKKSGTIPAKAAGTQVLGHVKAATFSFRIVHANDTHSALDLAPRLKTVMEEVRKADPGALRIHTGDALVGTPWYEIGGKGVADMKVLENLGFDIYVIGNHDLDGGVANLVNALKHTRAAVVVANWDVSGPLARRVKPYVIKEVNGRKVAVIGVSVNPADYGNATPDIVYRDPVETLAKLLPTLKEKAEAIVLASHLGNPTDAALAGYFPEIKAIIGGHSHTVTPFPQRFTHPDRSENLVTQAGSSGRFLGLMEVDLQNGRVIQKTGSLLSLSADIPEHPAMVKLLKPYAKKMAPFRQTIAETTRPISARPSAALDSRLGNLVTDVIREGAGKHLQTLGQVNAAGQSLQVDLAIFNSTGLRTGIPKGPITVGTLYTAFPFDNTLAITELTGTQVQAMLNHAAGRGGDPISGVTYAIERGRAVDITINGKPLDPKRIYRVAANSFMIGKGGSGYEVLTKGRNTIDTGLSIRQMLIDYFKQQGTLSLPQELERRTTVLSGEALGDIVRKKLGILRSEVQRGVEEEVLDGVAGKP